MDLAPIAGPQTWGRGRYLTAGLGHAPAGGCGRRTGRGCRAPAPGAAARGEPGAAETSISPACAAVMNAARRKLDDIGLAVIDRVPVERYSVPENRAVGWLLASMLGPVVAQTLERHAALRRQGYRPEAGLRRAPVRDRPGTALPHRRGLAVDATGLRRPLLPRVGAGGRGEPVRQPGDCAQRSSRGRRPSSSRACTARSRGTGRPSTRPTRRASRAGPVFERDDRGALMARWYEDYIHNGHKLAGEPLDDTSRAALRRLARCRRRSRRTGSSSRSSAGNSSTSTTASSLIAEPRSRTPRTARGAGT